MTSSIPFWTRLRRQVSESLRRPASSLTSWTRTTLLVLRTSAWTLLNPSLGWILVQSSVMLLLKVLYSNELWKCKHRGRCFYPSARKGRLKVWGHCPQWFIPKMKLPLSLFVSLLFSFLFFYFFRGLLFWTILNFYKYINSSMFKDGNLYNCLSRLVTLKGFWMMVIYP